MSEKISFNKPYIIGKELYYIAQSVQNGHLSGDGKFTKLCNKWLEDKFVDGRIKLSSVTIEIAELRSGVSKLHARVANYRDIAGNKVKFKAITNGIDMKTWVLPEIMDYYIDSGILDNDTTPRTDFGERIQYLSAEDIREFKRDGRAVLNKCLSRRTDQYGRTLQFKDEDFIFDFKRRFVDYKRPEMPFRDPMRLRNILESHNAHYILSGRVHAGDAIMYGKLQALLRTVDNDPYLREHVHYLADYDEELAYGLSAGSNASINVPIVGLEACGTSWMKDVANLGLLISTHDGGVADGSTDSYLNVSGKTEDEELDMLYQRMEEALVAWENDFDLEFLTQKQLSEFLPVISGARMLHDYLDYLFPSC